MQVKNPRRRRMRRVRKKKRAKKRIQRRRKCLRLVRVIWRSKRDLSREFCNIEVFQLSSTIVWVWVYLPLRGHVI